MRNISIHDICSTMSSDKAKSLPAFHARTGSANTSFFSGTGKKYVYAKWSTRAELTTTLCHLMDKPETPSSNDIDVIESFVLSLYSVTSTLSDVNQARHQIFPLENVLHFRVSSPTKPALVEQKNDTPSGICRYGDQSIIAELVLPSPSL